MRVLGILIPFLILFAPQGDAEATFVEWLLRIVLLGVFFLSVSSLVLEFYARDDTKDQEEKDVEPGEIALSPIDLAEEPAKTDVLSRFKRGPVFDIENKPITTRLADEHPWPLTLKEEHLNWTERNSRAPAKLIGVTLFDERGIRLDKPKPLIHVMPPSAPGSLLVAGVSGSGKSAQAKTCILSACMTSSPRDYQLYIVDTGGKNIDYAWCEDYPHVADTLTTLDDYLELKNKIESEYTRRIDLCLQASKDSGAPISNIKEYNKWAEENGEQTLPMWDVFYDEYAEIIRQASEHDEVDVDDIHRLTQRIAQVYRKVGIITTVMTQYPLAKVLSRDLTTQILNRVSFKLSDSTATRVVLGDTVPFKPHDLPGIDQETHRGSGRMVYMQGGSFFVGQAFYPEPSFIKEMSKKIKEKWS